MANEETITILVTAHFLPAWLERLQRISPNLNVILRPTDWDEKIPDELWHDVEILYTFPSFMHFPTRQQAPRLRWIQLYSAGADRLMQHELYQTDVQVTTASGVHATAIGEYVLMTMLAWFHRLPTLFSWQHERLWPRGVQRSSQFQPEELRDKTIGIVGYGSIGREVARLATAFGMRVLAMQRGNDHRDPGFIFPGVGDHEGTLPERYYSPQQLHEMLAECDVVVAGVPLTTETRGLFDDAAFRAMKSTAFFVNIARGDVADEDALIRALEEQRIAGAALDVFHQEPLPASSPLWSMPNVLISPHITGVNGQYDERAATIFIENVRQYVQKQPLYNLVDKGRGY